MHALLISMVKLDGNAIGAIGFAVFGVLVIGVLIWLIMTDPEKKEESKD